MLNESDQEKFTLLWTEAQPSVSHFILSVIKDASVAKDLLQATALVLLRKFEEYEASRPFLPWALGVAKFQILSHRRDAARGRITFDSELLDQYTETWAELSPKFSREASALQVCIRKLPDRLRTLVRLRYFEDLASHKISEKMNLTAGNVRVTLQRVREQLRQCVQRQLRAEGDEATGP